MDKSHVIQYSSESTDKLNTLSDLRQCRWRPLLIIGHTYQIQFNLQKIVNLVSLQQHLNKNKQNKRSKKPLWGKEQVNKFLELLKVYGSDFSIIAKVMGKERIDIRRKFKYLQKNNPKLIDIIFDDKPSLCPQQLNEFLDY